MAQSNSKNWEKTVGLLVGNGRVLFGAAILPILPDAPGQRKSVMWALPSHLTLPSHRTLAGAAAC